MSVNGGDMVSENEVIKNFHFQPREHWSQLQGECLLNVSPRFLIDRFWTHVPQSF